MHRALPVLLATLLSASAAQALAAQDPSRPPSATAIRTLAVTGASIYTAEQIAERHQLVTGLPLPASTDDIATAIRDQYRESGYILASVTATFDEGDGRLGIEIQEGRFDAIEIEGVPEPTRTRLLDLLALQPGEIFNAAQGDRALDEALAVAQGAIERVQPTFRIIPDAGRRVLHVALQTRASDNGVFLGSRGREDWYSPVDGLNAAFGVHGTVFDHSRFNHTYWSGFVSYKTASERAGYSFGLERSFLADGVLQVGASIQDLTGSDDFWRLSETEQSLVAVGFRNTFRDYYRRKGYQVYGAVRPVDGHELFGGWRDEEHASLVNETNFGFFRGDHPFRQNAPAQPGDLRAVILGYTFTSQGLARQRPAERYRRHTVDDLFGDEVDPDAGFRVEWRSELAPEALGHDFDFTRHIVQTRLQWDATPRRRLSARILGGGSTGVLPPQRLFALGGIGSVRAYDFKETAGDGMILLNAELRQRLFRRTDISGLVMLDVGRVYGPVGLSSTEWLKSIGLGIAFDEEGPRLEFGWRLDDVPGSFEMLFRLRRTF